MNNIVNEKAYEQLVKRVEELEAKIKERPTKEKNYRDLRKDLGSYDDKIRTQKDIVLKDTAYIKNRKGFFQWAENVLSLGFSKTDPRRLNQIQIGQDRDETTGETLREANTVFITATKNPNADVEKGIGEREIDNYEIIRASNGAILMTSIREDLDYGGIQIGERKDFIKDKEGITSMLMGSKKNGLAGIGNYIELDGVDAAAICLHTEEDEAGGGVYRQHLKQFVDLLPSSDGQIVPSLGRKNFHYRELVLRSPDGSSWAVRVDNNGNLTRTKL